ncbi:putative 2EXR domain-containing protein [Seiridium cardinale]
MSAPDAMSEYAMDEPDWGYEAYRDRLDAVQPIRRFNQQYVEERDQASATQGHDYFHLFMDLPIDIRVLIWEQAKVSQNRVVPAFALRYVSQAYAPTVFLVCRESREWATRNYRRARNGDLLDLVSPSDDGVRGPLICLDTDIFLVQELHWWNGSDRIPTSWVPGFRIHEGVAPRRVCVDERADPIFAVKLYWPSVRGRSTTFVTVEPSSEFDWTQHIDEVWYSDQDGMIFGLIYPPPLQCECPPCTRLLAQDWSYVEFSRDAHAEVFNAPLMEGSVIENTAPSPEHHLEQADSSSNTYPDERKTLTNTPWNMKFPNS